MMFRILYGVPASLTGVPVYLSGVLISFSDVPVSLSGVTLSFSDVSVSLPCVPLSLNKGIRIPSWCTSIHELGTCTRYHCMAYLHS